MRVDRCAAVSAATDEHPQPDIAQLFIECAVIAHVREYA
jgi:hypothetical protein